MIQSIADYNRRRGDPRSGFTLMELLLVIAIIAVLSTLGLAVMVEAQDTARQSATQSRIRQIESILQIQLEDYEVRRMPIGLAELTAYVTANRIDSPNVPILVQVKNLRRRILADIITSELPAPLFDTTLGFLNNPSLGVFPSTYPPVYNPGLGDWLDLSLINGGYPNPVNGILLKDRLAQLKSGESNRWENFNGVVYAVNPTSGNLNSDFDLPGEYLYEILLRTDFEGVSGIETLGNAVVGDSDDDGILEIVDAWGESMQLRILQIDAVEDSTAPHNDKWIDDPNVDWTFEDPANNFLPRGYAVIDPTIPRSIRKIRFHVVSPHLDAY